MRARDPWLGGAVLVYFLIALEFLVMISPFAGFFYALFNPALALAGSHASTRWLGAFYLPHLVLPDDPLLVGLRILGSALALLGLGVFLVCAVQVYAARMLHRGPVIGGFYRWLRHPQYLALATAGAGLSILWPRFLTVVLWLLMVGIYVLLARDEERRMLAAHPDAYRSLQARTGRFLPRPLERRLAPGSRLGRAAAVLAFCGLVLATPFVLRFYTVRHLTLWTGAPDLAALAILPEDRAMLARRMPAVLALGPVRDRLRPGRPCLVYVMPRGYLMQGLVADTGERWRLFERHRTFAMVADWLLHPFAHLRGGGHHAMMAAAPGEAMTRRLVVVAIEGIPVRSPYDLFAINAARRPAFLADVDMHALRVLEVRDLPVGSGWGSVPTPVF